MSTPARYSIAPLRGRRGFSPLIATVLLLAFAVALGVMAVSYVLQRADKDACDVTSLALDDRACFADERISFVLQNSGEIPISGGKVTIIGARSEITESQLSLALDAGSRSSVDIPYQSINIEGATVVVTPQILEDDVARYCTTQELRVPLVRC